MNNIRTLRIEIYTFRLGRNYTSLALLLTEGNESVTNCNALKMAAVDGKQRLTVAGWARCDYILQGA